MAKSRVVLGLVPVLGLAAACSGGRAPSPEADSGMSEAEATTEVTGRVAVVGNTPFERVVIRREGAGDLEVRGAYSAEIRRLSGATVRLIGTLEDADRFTVERYEVVEVVGRRPIVGILVRSDGGFAVRVHDDEIISIGGVPEELRENVGAKVWVTLDPNHGVQAYGIIRAPEM